MTEQETSQVEQGSTVIEGSAQDVPAQDVAAEGKGDVDSTPTTQTSLLEREGEVAADFLEQLLDIADLDGDIDVDVDGDRAAVAIVDSEEGRVSRRLVGSDGKVLEALQELTRLAVQASTGERSRLMLDVAGYRAELQVKQYQQGSGDCGNSQDDERQLPAQSGGDKGTEKRSDAESQAAA